MIKLRCNCCDGIFNTLDVHFTKVCDNNCAHCVDKMSPGISTVVPDVDAISKTIIDRADTVNDVLFLGGEPCLYLDQLIECVKRIRNNTHLKIYVTTSLPKTCYDNKEKLYKLIELLDCLNISVQHYNEDVADKIRCSKSQYDRQSFYKELADKYSNKIRICMNLVKGCLDTKEEITNALFHYNNMGFKHMKLSEIQNYTEYWVSFEELFGLKLPSPYSHGCQTFIDTKFLGENFTSDLLLRRSCFKGNSKLKASFGDLCKVILQFPVDPMKKSTSGIVYEDGSFHTGWI